MLFAVQDFSAAAQDLSLDEQEVTVADLLAEYGLKRRNPSEAARQLCDDGAESAGQASSQAVSAAPPSSNASFGSSFATTAKSPAAAPVADDSTVTSVRGNNSAPAAPGARLIAKFETSSLDQLPAGLDAKVRGEKFRSAAVVACEPSSDSDFTHYRLAVLLY